MTSSTEKTNWFFGIRNREATHGFRKNIFPRQTYRQRHKFLRPFFSKPVALRSTVLLQYRTRQYRNHIGQNDVTHTTASIQPLRARWAVRIVGITRSANNEISPNFSQMRSILKRHKIPPTSLSIIETRTNRRPSRKTYIRCQCYSE